MRKQPSRGSARTQYAGQSYDFDAPQPGRGLGPGFGAGGKIARTLANFQGRSAATELDNAAAQRGGVGQVARPRPGKIEVPQSTSLPPGSPTGNGKAAAAEAAGNKPQQAPGSQLSPAPQRPQGPAQEGIRFMSAPEEHRSHQSYGSFLASNMTARPQSPRNERELQGAGSPRQLSPRPGPPQPPNPTRAAPGGPMISAAGPMAPGQKLGQQKASGPPKIAFGRSAYTAPDQFSAMSTVSVASISEESVPARKFRPLQRSQSAGALSARGMGSSPQKSYAWRNRLFDQGRDNFLVGTRSPRSARSLVAESPRAGKSEDGLIGKATGHTDFVPFNFDRGRGKPEHPLSALGRADANVEAAELTAEFPGSSKLTTEKGKTQREGLEAKLSMTLPPDARSVPERPSPTEMSVAGVVSSDFPNNRSPARCWETTHLGESCASASSTYSAKKPFPQSQNNSAKVKEGFDHDATQGREVEEDFFKSVHGRHMRLGRHQSEPPRSQEKRKDAVERKHFRNEDYTKDESIGSIVPCLSPDSMRQSETHAALPLHSRKQGEFKPGASDYANKLAVQKEQSTFRVEHHLDKSLNERSASTLALSSPSRRHPESARAGRSGVHSRDEIMPRAGMTTSDLGKAASSQNLQSQSRGRNLDHLESPHMTSILKNAVAKDADRIRAFRETHDQPFKELCSAFANIRESHNKDAQRIRNEVCMNSSHNVASVLRHCPSPRSQSCGAQMRTARSQPKDTPAAESPSRGRFNTSLGSCSLQMEQALKWIC